MIRYFEYFSGKIPANTNSTKPRWSDFYMDSSGQGKMTTLSKPVFITKDGRRHFEGVVGIDVLASDFGENLDDNAMSVALKSRSKQCINFDFTLADLSESLSSTEENGVKCEIVEREPSGAMVPTGATLDEVDDDACDPMSTALSLRLLIAIIVLAISLLGIIFGVIGTKLQLVEKLKIDDDANDEENVSTRIIDKTDYHWESGCLRNKHKFVIKQERDKLILTCDGGNNCFQRICCSKNYGQVYTTNDISFVQTTLINPFACFIRCGPRYGWVLLKYTLWATVGNFGLHRLVLLPRPYSKSTKIMLALQLFVGLLLALQLLVGLLSVPLTVIFLIIRLVDMIMVFFWEAGWMVRIHLKGGNGIVEVVMDKNNGEEQANRLRRELYTAKKKATFGVSSTNENEIDTFLYPETKNWEIGCFDIVVNSIQVGKYHLQMKKQSRSYFECNDVFLTTMTRLSFNTPATYPWWYVFSRWVPPWGCFGCHRHPLGYHEGLREYAYCLSLGYFSFGWCYDGFWIFNEITRITKDPSIKLIYGQGGSFQTGIGSKEMADNLIGYIKKQTGEYFDIYDAPAMPEKTMKRDIPHRTSICDWLCSPRQVEHHSSTFGRDQILLTNSLETKQVPCVPPSTCFPLCWIPSLCCPTSVCVRCLHVTEKRSSTNVIYGKNVRAYETQQDSFAAKCICCEFNRHFIYYPETGLYSQMRTREDVAEAAILMHNNTSLSFAELGSVKEEGDASVDDCLYNPHEPEALPQEVELKVMDHSRSTIEEVNKPTQETSK
jgi:hypothetical protein